MSTAAKCCYRKGQPGFKAAPLKAGMKLSTGTFELIDGSAAGSFTTLGVDQSGAHVDISGVASLKVEADPGNQPGGVVADVPVGMTCKFTPPTSGSGSSSFLFTATWNDGSIGPFTFSVVFKYSGGAIVDIVVVPTPVTP